MKSFLFLLTLTLSAQLSEAQSYTISTIAGNGHIAFTGDGQPALYVRLIEPQYVALDPAGNIYVSDSYYNQVFRIAAADGSITVVAGTGLAGFSGDGGPATSARLNKPLGLVFDAAGNLYIADNFNWRVRMVTPDGMITTIAGKGTAGFGGNGSDALSASVQNPEGLAFDPAGNLYISQPANNVVRIVDTSGIINVFAGTGDNGFTGDSQAATAAQLSGPTGVAADANGSVYIADQSTRIRRVGPDGVISTFAGSNKTALGDGGPALSAALTFPGGLAATADGSLYVADSGHFRIRVISPDGIITTVAGGGIAIADGPALKANLPFPVGVAVDSQGNVVIAARVGRQVRVAATDGSITTVAGVHPSTILVDGLAATSVSLLEVWGVAADSAGNVFVSDDFDNRIQMITPDGLIYTFAGDSLFASPADGSKAIILGSPWGLSFDAGGNLLVSAGSGETVFQLAPDATSLRVAGGNGILPAGDGGPAILASLGTPVGVVADTVNGGFFVADSLNHQIRRIDASGVITTYAGNGNPGDGGDGGAAVDASLNGPGQIALDAAGNLYIADTGNHRIRMVDTNGIITTVAGTGTAGGTGDGGDPLLAQLSNPRGVVVDAAGNLYISEGNRIRKVDLNAAVISKIAGSTPGAAGFNGDGGPAELALLSNPLQLALDASGNLYVADRGNFRVRKLSLVNP